MDQLVSKYNKNADSKSRKVQKWKVNSSKIEVTRLWDKERYSIYEEDSSRTPCIVPFHVGIRASVLSWRKAAGGKYL